MCGNRAEFMEAFLGCAWLGAIAVPLNVAARGPQLAHYLRNSGARLLIIEAELLDALAYIDMQRAGAGTHLAYWRAQFGANRAHPNDRYAAGRRSRSRRAQPIRRKRWRSSTPRARPDRRRAYAVRTRNISGGVSTASAIWKSAKATCSPPRCRCFTPTRWGHSIRPCCPDSTLVAEPRFSASRFWQRLNERRATITYLLGAMVPILLSREPSPDEQEPHGALRAGARRAREPAPRPSRIEPASICSTATARPKPISSSAATADERRAGRMGLVREGFDARVVSVIGRRRRPRGAWRIDRARR